MPEDKLLSEIAKCAYCGESMSTNPHPDAGKPSRLLEVGTVNICIPCLVLNRHTWAERAMKAENELAKIREVDELRIRDAIIEYSVSINQSYSNVWGLTQAILKAIGGGDGVDKLIRKLINKEIPPSL